MARADTNYQNKEVRVTQPSDKGTETKKKAVFTARLISLWVILLGVAGFALNAEKIAYFSGKPSLSLPQSAYELYSYAKSLASKRKLALAETYLKKAIELDPKFYKAMMELACVYHEQGDFIREIPLFQKALTLVQKDKTNQEIALYDLGKIYLIEQRLDVAWNYLREAYQMKHALGETEWPRQPADALFHVKSGDKNAFLARAKEIWPSEINFRLGRIQRTAFFSPQRGLRDCDKYLIDNPGSRFSAYVLLHKASILERLKRSAEAIDIFVSLQDADLKETWRQWIPARLFAAYLRAKQYSKALEISEKMYKISPETDLGVFAAYKYRQSTIYREMKDYRSEKAALHEIIKIHSGGSYIPRGPYSAVAMYELKAHSRLVELYAAESDYMNAFLQLAAAYNPLQSVMLFIMPVFSIGFYILLFLVFTRLFFNKKAAEPPKSPFRLWHLWLFWSLISLFPLLSQFAFLGFNSFTNNSLGNMRLDPLLLGIFFQEALIAVLCIALLMKYYKFDKETLGFMRRKARYTFGIPFLVVISIILFGISYEYFIDKILLLPLPKHLLYNFITQIAEQGRFTQKLMLIVNVAIVTPVSEEILFRVLLFLFLKR
jgi:tetratricopeptide (TPR) repeat protein